MRIMTRMFVAASVLLLAAISLPAQTPATHRVMREKLGHAERVLDALMTNDHGLLAKESSALESAMADPGWAVLRNDRYLRHTEIFRRAVEDLVDAATRRDSDGAMRGYVSMTLACYSCHRYLTDSRIATPAR
jgi:hypothetical protein